MSVTIKRTKTDLVLRSKFYASGRRDSNMMRYHKLDPELFAMAAVRSQAIAEANGKTNWTVEKFFNDYAAQLVD